MHGNFEMIPRPEGRGLLTRIKEYLQWAYDDFESLDRFLNRAFVNGWKGGYYPRLMRMLRILGLMTVISYMTVILFTWIYANVLGYVYFSAGEPVLMIKYPEWLLGFIGIFVAVDLLCKELDMR